MKNKKIKLLASCISTIAATFGVTYSITSTSKEVKDNSSNLIKLDNQSVNTPVLNSSESDYEFDFRDLVKDDCRSSVSGKIRCLIDHENKRIRLLDASNGSIKGANIKFSNLISFRGESYIITSIAPNAFKNVTTLTGTIEFPSSLKSVGDYAFQGCNQITGSIILPTTVTYIGDYAFDGCNQITGLTIPSSVKYIGSCAFKECSSIANRVVIPNEITEILPSTFQGCSKLTEVTFSNKLTKIGQNAFNNCVKLANIVLPNSLIEIDDYAFNSCTSLTKVDISNHVTKIGSYSFQSCTGLIDVNVADSVELIDKYAFNDCRNLTNVNINEETSNLTKIGDYAFCYASKLKMINFPKKLESIGAYAFFADTAFVGTPKIPESVTEIGYYAFVNTGCNAKTIWGFNVAYSYEGEGYAKWLLAASFAQEWTNFAIEKNTIGIAGGAFRGYMGTGQLTLGGTDNRTLKYICDSAFALNYWSSIAGLEYTQIKTIGSTAFNNCSNLSGAIRLPNTIENIGATAFVNAKISSLAIDQDTTRTTKCTIGKQAFLNCSSLSGTLNIPTYVNEIGEDAFKGCTALTKDASNIVYSSEDQIGFNKWCIGIVSGTTTLNSLQFDSNVYGIAGGAFTGNTSLGKIIVGDNIEVIGDSAFKDCTNLSAVDLGHGKIKTIGNGAFSGCTSLSTNPLNQESQKSLESIGD
ncbi:MAG: leucine-rich repeat protein, partial [Mycoplasmataceae bacterium]|nr:leucine-rich repeat protein [Mycoplasmataceae bacterium]